MIHQNEIEIFITAGGKSSRMGQDKGLMKIAGKPMILHLTDRLAENHFCFKLIANSEKYKQYGFQSIKDDIPEKGPMGALYTALHHTDKEYILLIGCDTPFIPIEAIRYLITKAKPNAITQSIIHNKTNPLLAIYHHSIKPTVIKSIQENKLKMQDLISNSENLLIKMDEIINQYPNDFFNFNEPKDIELWKTKQ